MVGVHSTTSWSVALYPVSSSNSRRAATCASSSEPPTVVAALSKPEVAVNRAVEKGSDALSTGRKLCQRRKVKSEHGAGKREGIPMTCLSSGGRYCSRMSVDSGKALVLDLRMAKIATAKGANRIDQTKESG